MKKLFTKNNMNIWIPPIFMLILTILLLIFNIYAGLFSAILLTIIIIIGYEKFNNQNKEFKKFVDELDLAFEGFSKKAIFNMPFSIAVIDKDSNLVWYNQKFKNLVNTNETLIEENIFYVLKSLDPEHLKTDNYTFLLKIENKDYEVHKSVLEELNMTLLYFIDVTRREEILEKYMNERLVLINIRLDNYEELNQDISSEKRPILYAEIDSIITTYFHKLGSFIKKNENGKYFAVVFKSTFDQMAKDKFSFIESVRNLSVGNSIMPTLSIGVGYNEKDIRENEKSANAALDIALGRGGDQVVLKSEDKLDYFGGKNQATEKRTKVKARVIAHALAQLIEKSTEVFISGHKNPDMDSFGSSLGLWHSVNKLNKQPYIVLSEVTPAIKSLYDYATSQVLGLKESILTPDEAYEMAKASSLLIVTDNHRKTSIEESRLLDKTNSVVVIDHHRRGIDYIDNTILSYVEPSSSSASELVTEMLMYMNERVEIDKVIADALLAGITVDTKSFNQQTGMRTFEAAAILKQNGASTIKVNSLFRDNFETLKTKSKIVSNSEIYHEKYVFGIFEKDIEESTLIASQAADEMINIQNIQASFVLTLSKGKTHISARSYGDVSVQLIMEKLGGGGHRTMAATQLEVNIDQAKDLLKNAIKEYEMEDIQR